MRAFYCIFVFYLFSLFLSLSTVNAQISVNFSHNRGFYSENFDLVVETSGYNTSVLYTLDGSDPSKANNPITPLNKAKFIININRSTVVRLYIYNNEEKVSFTNTYILINDVFNQNNNSVINERNYPPIWGYGKPRFSSSCIKQDADYEMTLDSCITNIPNYEQKLLDGLMEIPTMAISLDVNQIFGADSGIYIFPVEKSDECYTYPEYINSWERKASVEIFNDIQGLDTLEFQLDAGLQMSGASTRYFDFYKHSFKLKFRSEYGSSKLNYPLYGDKATDKFESLQLRMIGQCSPHDWKDTRRRETQFHKDNWMRDIQGEMSGYGSSSTGKFFHLFINGLYWGFYDVSERPDEDYMAQYHGESPEDYDVLKLLEVKSGTDSAYNYMYDLGHSIYDTILTPKINQFTGAVNYEENIVTNKERARSFYQEMNKLLDIDKFIDYNLLNLYVVNTDWKDNNWWAARNAKTNGKFQFFVWDAEIVLTNAEKSNQVLLFGGNVGKALKYHPIDLNQRLLDVPEYKIKFGDHIQCHCVEEDGVLNPQNFLESYKAAEKKIHNASLLEFARWGDVRKENLNSEPLCPSVIDETLQEYETEIFPDLLRYMMVFYGRPDGDYALLPHYIKKKWSPNEGYVLQEIFNFKAVQFSKLGGEVDSGHKLVLTNLNTHKNENNEIVPLGEIYYTTDGSDPRNVDGTVANLAKKYSTPIVIDKYKMIKARVFVDKFNYIDDVPKTIDNLWTTMCPREFFPKNYYKNLIINEIHYNPADLGNVSGSNLEFIEIKNIGDYELNVSNVKFIEGIKYQFPVGTIIPSNNFALLALDSIAVVNYYNTIVDGQYSGKLANSGELILLARPDDETVDMVDYKDTWNTRTDGQGASLSLYLDISDKENNHLANSWGSSAGGVSPRTENVFCLPLNLNAEVYNPTCNGGNDAFISLYVSGGSPPYTINWLTGNNNHSNLLTNLASGNYEVEVIDDQNCVEHKTIEVKDPKPINSNLEITHSTFANSSDGYALVNPQNISFGYNVSWSDGSTGNSNYNLTAGQNYWVTIADANNSACSITESFTIEVASNCASPTNFSATSTSKQSAIISWNGNPTNTNYNISYKIFEHINWITVNTSVPYLVLSNLQPCKTYQYKVNANCNSIVSNNSLVKIFITSGCSNACGDSSNANIINITNNTAFILWDIIPEAKYRLKYRKNGVNAWKEYETSLNFSILFDLDNCANYEWFVEVICSDGRITPNSITNFTTQGCLRVTNTFSENDEKQLDNLDITLFPNPAQDFLKIKTNISEQPFEYQIMLYDFLGRLVLDGGTFIDDTSLNIKHLMPGIYTAQITNKDKNIQYKFTKQ